MALTMRLQMIGLGPRIGGSAENPIAKAEVLIENIDPSYTVADVEKKVIDFVDHTVQFLVPNPDGLVPYTLTILHLTSVLPEMVSHDKAKADVEWGLLKSANPETIDSKTGEKKKASEKGSDEELGPEFTWDTSGGTKHVTQSVYTRSAQKVGGAGNFSAPDVKRAIGIAKDKVEGCDIASGDLKWSMKIKGLRITRNYIRKLAEMTGTTNRYTFFGAEREELLLLGTSGTYKPGSASECQFNFHEKVTRRNVEFITGVVVPEVRGHDYLWAGGYMNMVVGGFTVQVPQFVYCEQVYDTSDFDDLGW